MATHYSFRFLLPILLQLRDAFAMTKGIHFISNFWFTSIIGGTENGFPALAKVERNLQLVLTTLIEYILPVLALIGLIVL